MIKHIARLILKITGWHLVEGVPEESRFIGLVAPHTSNWDFIWGKLAILGLGQKGVVLIKKELFFFPLGGILRLLGGKPVDRKKSGALLKQVIHYFKTHECFALFITPEGTRSATHRWKTGFHFIARHAEVPVYLTFLDYKTKRLGMHGKTYITDEALADMNRIKQVYAQYTPKFPEKFSTKPQ